ncbi:hypothetical protein GCM10028801_41210 [Nocardioides maradonensis]
MTLNGMLAEVTQVKVKGLLQQRDPDILDPNLPDQVPFFEARVSGAARQVVLLTGPDPVAGPVRDLAVEAIAVQTASEIEYAEYPEQQTAGDSGRGYHLHQRYLELLAELRKVIENNGGVPTDGGAGGISTSTARPRGNFPPAQCYPDPVRIRGFR